MTVRLILDFINGIDPNQTSGPHDGGLP